MVFIVSVRGCQMQIKVFKKTTNINYVVGLLLSIYVKNLSCEGLNETSSSTMIANTTILLDCEGNNLVNIIDSVVKDFIRFYYNTGNITRIKRQSGGAGKFTDAAKMPQVKLMRLMLQALRNTWANEYIGGRHPFHRDVPKIFVNLFHEHVYEFFFPDVGDDLDTKSKKKKKS